MQKADLEPLKLPNLTTEKDSSKDFGSVDGHYINSDSIRAGVDNVALLTTDPSAIKASVQFDMGEDVASKLASIYFLDCMQIVYRISFYRLVLFLFWASTQISKHPSFDIFSALIVLWSTGDKSPDIIGFCSLMHSTLEPNLQFYLQVSFVVNKETLR